METLELSMLSPAPFSSDVVVQLLMVIDLKKTVEFFEMLKHLQKNPPPDI